MTNGRTRDFVNRFVRSSREAMAEALPDLAEEYRNHLREILNEKLQRLVLTEEILLAYPFLEDKAKFVKDFLSCIVVGTEDQAVTIGFDKQRMSQFGFPELLPDILEYGNRVIRSLSYLRPAADRIRRDGWKTVREELARV